MNKLFSLTLTVLMAMCAMLLSSCGNDDDDKTEVDPDVTAHVNAIVTPASGYNQYTLQDQAVEVAFNYYAQVLSNCAYCKVNTTSKVITFKKSNGDKIKELISAASTESLDASLKKIEGLVSVYISLTDGDAIYGNYLIDGYDYTDTTYSIGTWKGTIGTDTYTLTINNDGTTDMDCVVYSATLVAGSTTYKGTYKASNSTNTYRGEFYSDDSTFIIYAEFDSSNLKQFTGDVVKEKKIIGDDIVFTKQ